jgi:hypothetical protein
MGRVKCSASAMAGAASSSPSSSDSPAPATSAGPALAGPILRGADAVLQDIADGAEPLTFARAAKLRCLSRDGRHRHVGFVHRAADPTKPHPLEFAVISGVRMTTQAAAIRWLQRNSGTTPSSSASWTPGRFRKEHAVAERQLDDAGI